MDTKKARSGSSGRKSRHILDGFPRYSYESYEGEMEKLFNIIYHNIRRLREDRVEQQENHADKAKRKNTDSQTKNGSQPARDSHNKLNEKRVRFQDNLRSWKFEQDAKMPMLTIVLKWLDFQLTDLGRFLLADSEQRHPRKVVEILVPVYKYQYLKEARV